MFSIFSSKPAFYQPEQGKTERKQQQGGGGRLGQPVTAELLVEQPGQSGELLTAKHGDSTEIPQREDHRQRHRQRQRAAQ
jgi:hypothetical protein